MRCYVIVVVTIVLLLTTGCSTIDRVQRRGDQVQVSSDGLLTSSEIEKEIGSKRYEAGGRYQCEYRPRKTPTDPTFYPKSAIQFIWDRWNKKANSQIALNCPWAEFGFTTYCFQDANESGERVLTEIRLQKSGSATDANTSIKKRIISNVRRIPSEGNTQLLLELVYTDGKNEIIGGE